MTRIWLEFDNAVFIDGELLCELCAERGNEVEDVDSGWMIGTTNEYNKEFNNTFKPSNSTIIWYYKCNRCNVTLFKKEI